MGETIDLSFNPLKLDPVKIAAAKASHDAVKAIFEALRSAAR